MNPEVRISDQRADELARGVADAVYAALTGDETRPAPDADHSVKLVDLPGLVVHINVSVTAAPHELADVLAILAHEARR